MKFVQTAKDYLHLKMAVAQASLPKNLEMFCLAGTELWHKTHLHRKVKVIQ